MLGAAIVAGYAIGVFDDLKATARRFVQTAGWIEPRWEYHRFYQSYVEQYIDLLSEATQFYRRLATLPEPPSGGAE